MTRFVTPSRLPFMPLALLVAMLATMLLMAGCDTSMLKPSGPEQTATPEKLAEMRLQADQLYRQQDFAGALPLYQQLNDRLPQDAQLWLRSGNSLARLNRYDEAIDSYRKAVVADPQLAIAWHNMGVLQLRQTANTFNRMAGNISSEDPLHPLAVKMSAATLQLLGVRQQDNEPRAVNE